MLAKSHQTIFFVGQIRILCLDGERFKLEEHELKLYKILQTNACISMDCIILSSGKPFLV